MAALASIGCLPPRFISWLWSVKATELALFNSENGGDSFDPPVWVSEQGKKVTSRGEDSPAFFVTQGDMFAAWNEGHELRFARSVNWGGRFEEPINVTDKAFPVPSTGAGIFTAFTLSYQNGLTYVGTGNAGIIFVYDASVPSEPRLMALNVISPYGLDVVSAITPGTNNLYTDVIDELIQLDNTIPQNSIELYFPPGALSNAAPITGDLRTAKTRRDIILGMAKQQSSDRNRGIVNPKFNWVSRRSKAEVRAMDRFGQAQRGCGECVP